MLKGKQNTIFKLDIAQEKSGNSSKIVPLVTDERTNPVLQSGVYKHERKDKEGNFS